MKRLFLFTILFFSLFVLTTHAQNTPKIIAHRGYWNCEGSAQNSIRSLEKAAEIGVYGSEFDVHLTADDVLVIYHDNEIDSMHIQSTPYAQLKNCRLSNGEPLPTLESFLKRAQTLKNIRLIFELKAHATPERNREAARRSLDMIRKYQLEDRTDYITFDLDAAKEFVACAPKGEVVYLNGELSPKALKAMDFDGLDYNTKVYLAHPQWISEAKQLGLSTNVWTIRTKEDAQTFIDMGIDYLTTDCPETVKALIQGKE